MSLSSSDTPTSDVDAAAAEAAAAASVSCGAVSVDDGFMSGFTAGTTGSVETSSIYSLSMFLILVVLILFFSLYFSSIADAEGGGGGLEWLGITYGPGADFVRAKTKHVRLCLYVCDCVMYD